MQYVERNGLNGHAPHPAAANPLTQQKAQALVAKVLTEALDLSGFLNNSQFFDPWDLIADTSQPNSWSSYPPNRLMTYRQSQKRGEDIPYYLDEIALRFYRDRQRKLVAENPYAQCAIANRVNYAVGAKGLKFKAVSSRKDCPPKLLTAAQRILDLWIEENDMVEYAQDVMRNIDINGESFTRHFPQDNGIVLVRPIEAEHVRAPTQGNAYGPEYSFGKQTRADDIEDVVGYWVVENPLVSSIPVFVPADQVTHIKGNSPRTAKRGLPLFASGSCELLLRLAFRLLTAMGSTAVNRAKIGMIKYLDGVVKEAAVNLANELATFTTTDPVSGQTTNVQQYRDGAILTVPANAKYEFPGSNFDAQVFEVAGQYILRAVAARTNQPEWMLTADPSSGTFANAFIAEAPSTKQFMDLQETLARKMGTNRSRNRRSMAWTQIVHAVKVGLLAPETLHLVQVQVEGQSLVVRDASQEATTNKTYGEMKVKSRKTTQMELGLDPEREDRSIAEEADKDAKMAAAAQPPGGAPGMPGAMPPGAVPAGPAGAPQADPNDPLAGVPKEDLSGGLTGGAGHGLRESTDAQPWVRIPVGVLELMRSARAIADGSLAGGSSKDRRKARRAAEREKAGIT